MLTESMTIESLDKKAKQIGSRQGLFATSIGLVTAQLIMTLLVGSDLGFIKGFLWFTTIDYKLNLLIGAIILLLCGHLYGRIAGRQIIIKKRNAILVGFLCGLAVLVTTAFLSGWTGFIREGINDTSLNADPFGDYILKPIMLVTTFGLIPTFLVGIWFGLQIERKGKKHST